MPLDLLSLKLFVRVLEEGTISQAAHKEHIASAAVSRRISELETQLNTQLLHRTNKGVAPTEAGLELLYRARNLLQNAQALKDHLHDFSQERQSHVHILANISALSQNLPHLLSEFIKKHPTIHLKIEEKNSQNIVYDIEKSKADIGIYSALPHDAKIESYFFRKDILGLLVPANHPLTQYKQLYFEQCLNYEQIVLRSGTQINYQITKAAMEVNQHIKVRAEIDSYETMALLVNAGMGIGVMPRQSTQIFQIPHTHFIELKDNWAQRQLVIGVRSKKELSASAKLLFDYLTKQSLTFQENTP
ncbi:LysR family transcriptional regulator [Paenalcaligenes hominis]|uniref:LysR family transcriptional regulator n=1 Tax=Paenalcaligenes hominis TaxID=643674 RepID=UPI003524F30A